MLKRKVITIGGCTEDISIYTDEGLLIDNKNDPLRQDLLAFEFGAKIKVNKSYSTFGGGASNVSVSLASLGMDVSIISSFGSDERADRLLKNLKKNGVNTRLTKRLPGTSSFSFLLIGPGNEHIVFSDRASNDFLSISDIDLKALNSAGLAFISSLSGRWKEVLDRVFSVDKLKIAWNPGGAQLKSGIGQLKKYLKKTYVLTLNKDEAIELVLSDEDYRVKDMEFLNNTKNLLHIIKEWGPQIVLITKGSEGAEVYDGVNFYREGVIKARRIADTTGVGDAFGSSFIAGLEMFKGDIKRSLRLAMYNSSSVIAEHGAQNGLLTKKQISKIL